jgi:outer membrane lipoprotein-sorting protein
MVTLVIPKALLRAGMCLLAAGSLHLSGAVPAWWSRFPKVPILESRFRQESESLVFGKLARTGTLVLAQGGRLRVAYEGGLTVTCDGHQLVQLDPDTRTAQRMPLPQAQQDFPLLNLLTDPAKIRVLYRVVELGGDALKLVPRQAGLPELKLTGRKGLLHSLQWTDQTGANQNLELLDPRTPASVPASLFKAQIPAGTRWATPND